MYPSIKEYKEAILFAEDNFEQMNNLRPVLDEDGNPVMSSGSFAVVFKLKDEHAGRSIFLSLKANSLQPSLLPRIVCWSQKMIIAISLKAKSWMPCLIIRINKYIKQVNCSDKVVNVLINPIK